MALSFLSSIFSKNSILDLNREQLDDSVRTVETTITLMKIGVVTFSGDRVLREDPNMAGNSIVTDREIQACRFILEHKAHLGFWQRLSIGRKIDTIRKAFFEQHRQDVSDAISLIKNTAKHVSANSHILEKACNVIERHKMHLGFFERRNLMQRMRNIRHCILDWQLTSKQEKDQEFIDEMIQMQFRGDKQFAYQQLNVVEMLDELRRPSCDTLVMKKYVGLFHNFLSRYALTDSLEREYQQQMLAYLEHAKNHGIMIRDMKMGRAFFKEMLLIITDSGVTEEQKVAFALEYVRLIPQMGRFREFDAFAEATLCLKNRDEAIPEVEQALDTFYGKQNMHLFKRIESTLMTPYSMLYEKRVEAAILYATQLPAEFRVAPVLKQIVLDILRKEHARQKDAILESLIFSLSQS